MQKVLKYTAIFFSWIFHPLIIPSLACLVFFSSGHYLSLVESRVIYLILTIFLIMTFLMPLMMAAALYYFNIIDSLKANSKKDRIILLTMAVLLYAFGLYFMKNAFIPPILTKIVLASAVSMVLCIVATIFYRISLHACGVGGLSAFVLFLGYELSLNVMFFLMLSFLLSGIVLTARLFLKAHSPAQVYSGWILGFITIYFTYLLF